MSDEQGGYAAMLHENLKKMYQPDSPLDTKSRVFLFIHHQMVRDWKYVEAISRAQIKKATGVEDRYLTRVLESLEKDKMIISHKSKTGKAWNPTQYALHPSRFGLDTLWRGKPELIAKENKSTSFQVHQEGKIIPITRKRVLPTKQEGVSTPKQEGGPAPQAVPKGLNFSELQDKLGAKNPIQEPNQKEPSSKVVDKSTSGEEEWDPKGGEKAAEKAAEIMRNISGSCLKRMPG